MSSLVESCRVLVKLIPCSVLVKVVEALVEVVEFVEVCRGCRGLSRKRELVGRSWDVFSLFMYKSG